MLIYGRNPVLEALSEGQVERLLAAKGIEDRFKRELEQAARKAGVAIEWVARIELDREFGTTQHQGLAAELADADFAEPEAIFDLATAREQQPLIILLDGITDPRNFGAIIRSAEVLGAHGVVVEERRSAPLSAVAVKASAGATAYLPVAQVKNLPRYMDELKERGVWLYGAAGEAKKTVAQLDYKRPLGLVIGAEGEGLRRLVRDKCDELVGIPSKGKIQSLNASVATAILIYEAVTRRG
jgi:23S rRNA (guanosine2251-2'-O)-methyltransferase